jgi:hypothetical protein
MVTAIVVTAMALVAPCAYAAEPPVLAKARALYNAADYDGAIAAAVQARTQPGGADAAALVEARAHLERYRQTADSADLGAARDALSAIHSSALMPRDQLDFFVGLGQSLYFGELFGPAAELFDTAWAWSFPAGTRSDDAPRLVGDRARSRGASEASRPPRATLRTDGGADGRRLRQDGGAPPATGERLPRAALAIDAAWDAAVAA